MQQCTLHEAHVDAIKEWAQRAKFAEKKLAALAEPVLNPAPGYCKHCKQYTIEEPLPAEPVQEPYCYVYEYDSPHGLHREFYPREYNGMKPTRTVQVYTAPPQRKLAEPVQEPVAWIHTDPDKRRVKFLEWRENEPGYRGDWIKTPLFTAPGDHDVHR